MSSLDRGRAHDVLKAQEWLALPLKQREPALFDQLDACIDQDPRPRPQTIRQLVKPTEHAMYLALSGWAIIGGIFTFIYEIAVHQQIDLLPFISITLGTVAAWTYLRPTRPIR